jgi:hypothetical protein
MEEEAFLMFNGKQLDPYVDVNTALSDVKMTYSYSFRKKDKS